MFTIGQSVTFRGNPARVVEVLSNAVVLQFPSGARFTVWPAEIAPAEMLAPQPSPVIPAVHTKDEDHAQWRLCRDPLHFQILGADRAHDAAGEARADRDEEDAAIDVVDFIERS